MSAEICRDLSPWKSTPEVTRASLNLRGQGISIAGMSEQKVLALDQGLSRLAEEPKPLTMTQALEKIDILADAMRR